MDLYDVYSSCWSYVHSDGSEYAFEFSQSGASVVRLTDPSHPVEVAFFNLYDSAWHEGRQYQHWFYISTEFRTNQGRTNSGLTIIDMADPEHPHVVASYHSILNAVHTLELDAARGILYACGGSGDAGNGMYIFSLANPENPTLLTVYGNEFPDYTHEIHLDGLRGYASMQILRKTRVLDLTDPAHPSLIAEFESPGGRTPGGTGGRTHSATPVPGGHFVYVTDEVSGVGAYVYDLQDLSNIRQVYRFEGMPFRTIAHEPIIRENLLFLSYYTAGARVYDVSNPGWPAEVGYYDTFPGRDGGFHGVWEEAPIFPSGIFIASDIETGLWVFRVNTNYGIVRGTVRQASNGPILSGVSVSGGGASTVSFSDGRYSIAADPGSSVTLTFSQFGYEPQTKALNVTAGSDQTFDASLRLKDAGALSGLVRRASDSVLLPEAEITVLGTPLRAQTDANGAFTIASIPVGSYQVRCVRPGHVPRILAATVTKGKTTALSFSLASPLSYDDAEADRGWALGDKMDDATSGIWARGVPNGTIYNRTGEPIQTSADRTPSPGVACFVTGNAPLPPVQSFTDCVKGGQTTLTSPVFHLGGVADPRIGFWRWYANYFFEFTPDDPLVTQLSNDGGQTWVNVDSLYELPSGWQFTELAVANTFANPGDVLLRFIASDHGDPSLVEAAIDDISSYSGSGISMLAAPAVESVANTAPSFIGRPHPSPTRGSANIDLSLPRTTRVRADVFDIQGRLVRNVQDGALSAGLHVLSWDGTLASGTRAAAGSYWMKVSAEGATQSSRLVIIR